jgi:hypothetical protein
MIFVADESAVADAGRYSRPSRLPVVTALAVVSAGRAMRTALRAGDLRAPQHHGSSRTQAPAGPPGC